MSTAPVLPRTAESAESTPTGSTRSVWEQLVETWRDLDVPEGWRAEVIEERIVMTPPPSYTHSLTASRVHKALVQAIPGHWAVFQTAAVSVPLRSSRFIPDLVVVPEDRLPEEDDSEPVQADKVLLTVEITLNSNAETDRTTNLHGYARGGVPLYLLIDRFAGSRPSVELFSKPDNGTYQESHRVPFGEEITLPEPFELTLKTDEF